MTLRFGALLAAEEIATRIALRPDSAAAPATAFARTTAARASAAPAGRCAVVLALAAAVHTAREIDKADRHRIAAIGFCFGGMCVLDLARAGLDGVVGVVSLHGLLMPTTVRPGPRPMKARVLACHGYNDPMARPEAVLAFAKEMTDAGCDWTMMMFGHRGHAFTNPIAQFPQQGMQYCERAEHRSMAAMDSFLAECFADKQLRIGAVPAGVGRWRTRERSARWRI